MLTLSSEGLGLGLSLKGAPGEVHHPVKSRSTQSKLTLHHQLTFIIHFLEQLCVKMLPRNQQTTTINVNITVN